MMRPELMSLLKISLHKNEVPSFLNEISKIPYFQIREFLKPKGVVGIHERERAMVSTEREMIKQKINEIEENLIFLFQKIEMDPDDIKPDATQSKLNLEVKDLESLIDSLHEKTENEKRRLKGYFNDIDKYSHQLQDLKMYLVMLKWLQNYNLNSNSLKLLSQLNFALFECSPDNFEDINDALQHEEYAFIIQDLKISPNKIVFFIIYHRSHEKSINEITSAVKAEKNEDYQHYLTETGYNRIKIEEELKFATERLEKGQNQIAELKNKAYLFRAYLEILGNTRNFIHMEEQFYISPQNQIVQIEAFVRTKDQETISQELIKKFQTRIRIIAKPIEREMSIRQKEEQDEDHSKVKADDNLNVPSYYEPSKVFKPFKLLVDLYGTTNYSELDPTPIIAFTYPIIFGLMFGDVGHGIVLIIFGLLLIVSLKKTPENKMRDFGFLLFWLGWGAILGGLLYGEFFGYELMINGRHFMIIANPLHDIITVFKFAILIGVIHINLGWFLSMVNYILKKRRWTAFTEPFLKILLLTGGTYLIFTYKFDIFRWLGPPYPILLAIIPAALIVIAKPIGKALQISYLKKESTGQLITDSLMDVGETYLGILSNVASYSRLLALAMAHMGLMLIFTTMAELLSNTRWVIPIVLIFGNLFVIVIEGFLAGIHALRLHLYEFFGKFYLGDGVRYESISIKHDFSEIKFLDSSIIRTTLRT